MRSPVTPCGSGRSSAPASFSHTPEIAVLGSIVPGKRATGGEARDQAGVRGGGCSAEPAHDARRGKAVDAFLETITDTLRSGGDVAFTGFGKFQTQQRAARTGVNPRNPTQKVEIPAARVPKFSAGSALKSAVKNG